MNATDISMVRVWDLPTRVFHWLMVCLFLFLVISGEQGDNWMHWHMQAGYLISGLVLFRILWGFVGSHHARFVNFIRSPLVTLHYLFDLIRGEAAHYPGHNPVGAVMVVALLLTLGLQSLTGLIITDDVLWNGPLYTWVSDSTAELGGAIHRTLEVGLKLLALTHILAVLFHKFRFKEPLISAMIHGRKPLPPASAVDVTINNGVLMLGLAIAGGWVSWLWILPI